MKKIVYVILFISLSLILSSCQKDENNNSSNNECLKTAPVKDTVLNKLTGFSFEKQVDANLAEAEKILKFLCPEVYIHYPYSNTICGKFPSGYHLTLWAGANGKKDRYAAKYGTNESHSFISDNDTYFEILKSLNDIVTLDATALTYNSATLNGSVKANGSNLTVYFEYGTTSYEYSVNATPNTVSGTTNTSVAAAINNLNSNTEYRFRLKVVGTNGTTYGVEKKFKTIQSTTQTEVITKAATSITQTEAKLNGTVNPKGVNISVVFEYGTTTEYGKSINAVPNSVSGSTNTDVYASLTQLTPNTTYHYRVKAVGTTGTVSGADMTFTTAAATPATVATTNSATAITPSTATLNGTVNANTLSTTISFEYGTTTSYGRTINANPSTASGTSSTNVSANITGLTANSTYHFRIKAVNSAGTTYGDDLTFSTLPHVFSYNQCSDGYDYTVDPSKYIYKGTVCATNLIDTENDINVAKIEFRYEFGSFFGEPTQKAIFRWTGSTGAKKIGTIGVKCKVYNSSNVFTGYYFHYSPLVSSTDNEWSWDTTGSPSWDKVFKNDAGTFMDATSTKNLFKTGFKLQALTITKLNEKPRP